MLRVLLGASLGLGVLDLAWLDLVAAPAALSPSSPSPSPSTSSRPIPVLTMALAMPPPEPAPEPTPVPVPATTPTPMPAPTPTPSMQHIYFATLHANVDHAAHPTLVAIAAQAGTRATITLEGHADYRGPEALNLSLRRGRALATLEALARLGVPRAHLAIRVAPPAASVPEVELWRDRRVDIAIESPPTPARSP